MSSVVYLCMYIFVFRWFLMILFRDHHPENVLSSMETIMTLVIEESEDISVELLTPILECLRKDNEVRYHSSDHVPCVFALLFV